jgi:hypothetical protein
MRVEGFMVGSYRKYVSMKILGVRAENMKLQEFSVLAINFARARS